jgi:hypothetical protein
VISSTVAEFDSRAAGAELSSSDVELGELRSPKSSVTLFRPMIHRTRPDAVDHLGGLGDALVWFTTNLYNLFAQAIQTLR